MPENFWKVGKNKMLNGSVQFNELDSFKQANSLLKSSSLTSFDETFEQALEAQVKEASSNAKDKANEIVEDSAGQIGQVKDFAIGFRPKNGSPSDDLRRAVSGRVDSCN